MSPLATDHIAKMLNETKTNWVRRYFDLARHVAAWSKDPSTKVGAVIVGRNRKELCVGYNGFPPGIADDEVRLLDKVVKYKLTIHAERNALDNARFDVRGGTMASTQMPCSECAKSIVSMGIKRVISPSIPEKEPWKTDALVSIGIFKEAGVEMVTVLPEEER